MKIRHLEIRNFRGVKSLEWCLPDNQIITLIGKGDSCKTTILEAIRLAFYPHWALQLSDVDFFKVKIDDPIVIRVTLGDLPEEFLNMGKFGLHLRGWNPIETRINDEPQQYEKELEVVDDEPVITVQLKVESDLEPNWRVVTDRNPDGISFPLADRKLLNATFIGAYSNRMLTWDAQSPLSKLTEEASVQSNLAKAARAAKGAFDANREDLDALDKAAAKVYELSKKLGVQSSDLFRSHLDLGAINVKAGGISLHEGDVPLRQLGLGSRRMLTCGLQAENLKSQHITLIDELENGLEPHRISRLLKHLKEDPQGSYLLTTHSPIVLRELNFEELNIVHNEAGIVTIKNTADRSPFDSKVQGTLRSHAEAFLCPKVIVCEGATEVGFIRGMDDFYVNLNNESLSYHGVSYLDAASGSQVKPKAEVMHSLGYKVAAFADSDDPKQFGDKHKKALEEKDITVIMWDGAMALEQRLFLDLPWDSVIELLSFAKDDLGLNICAHVESKLGGRAPDKIKEWIDTEEFRKVIGDAAKSSSWFKNITLGEILGKKTTAQFHEGNLKGTDTHKKMEELRVFVAL
tara:strand:- start:3949 stop:5673 length:1725 start_codon:yes stop_codon:yes gene_type:complete